VLELLPSSPQAATPKARRPVVAVIAKNFREFTECDSLLVGLVSMGRMPDRRSGLPLRQNERPTGEPGACYDPVPDL
jgi:hypothetical protein